MLHVTIWKAAEFAFEINPRFLVTSVFKISNENGLIRHVFVLKSTTIDQEKNVLNIIMLVFLYELLRRQR